MALLLLVATALPAAASAADTAAGKRLVEQKRCESCHHAKTLGDAPAIYLRKDRKVTTRAKLDAQVALCNSELNLQLFPDEEADIAAYLDQAYYHFK